MNRWKTLPLAEACEKITDGTHHSPPIQSVGIPYVTAKHIKADGPDFFSDPWFVSENDHRVIFSRCDPRPGDVLYIKDGATTGIAAVNRYAFEFSMLSSVALLRPRVAVLTPEFLCHWLNAPLNKHRILGGMAGVAIRRLTLEKINAIRIPLPPVLEQQRIAAILDKADELRAKRRAVLAKLDSLTQSIFLDMFGDPATNPKNYPVALMGDVCDVRDGTHDSPKYVSDSGYPLVTSKNVTGGAIDLTEVNYISEAAYVQINKRSKVDKGDIILPMIGTIGSPVLVDHDPNYAIKNVALIKFIEGSPAAVYLHHLLSGRYFDHIVSRKNRGGTQKFVSLGDLRAFPLPLPPRQEQDEFLRRMEEIRRIRSLNSVAASRLDDVFTSLQSHAFRGEL